MFCLNYIIIIGLTTVCELQITTSADLGRLEILLAKLGSALIRSACRVQLVRLFGQRLGYVVEYGLHVGAIFSRRLDEIHVVALRERLSYMIWYLASFG